MVEFKSRKDLKKKLELEEARKAGLAPAEVDEDGKVINPHIPHYLSIVPFYIRSNSQTEGPSLKHQRKQKSEPNSKSSYDRGGKVHQADKYRKGACENCGAMRHDPKSCMQRPRKVGAKFTNSHIAPDDKMKSFVHDRKRDPWDGYDLAKYVLVQEKRHEAREEARRKYLEEQVVKKLEGNINNQGDSDGDGDYWIDESKQMDFAKIEKRVRTTGGGSTGTVRNFRFREDTAKYLVNLDLDSAYYDPKTRSMRENPLPNADPNEKFYGGDNQYRNSGQALEFKLLNNHSYKALKKGLEIHLQAAPSQAEFIYNNHQVKKAKLISQMKDTILEKYGNAAAVEEELPRELLLGQSETEVEYDRAGRIIKGQF